MTDSDKEFSVRIPYNAVIAWLSELSKLLGDVCILIHLDIDGTLTIHDLTAKQANHMALINEFMSKGTFGTVDREKKWSIKVTDRMKQSNGEISHYEHHRTLLPGKENESKLKAAAANFITTDGAPMIKEFTLMKEKSSELIFSSFYRLIDVVRGIFPKAKFIFRTFGRTGPNLIKELERRGYLWADSVGKYSIGIIAGNRMVKSNATGRLMSYAEFNDELCADKRAFFLIQEHYNFWNANGRDAACGKFAFGCDTLQFAFDDIASKCWDSSGPNVAIKEVSTYRACTDDEYFVRAFLEMLHPMVPNQE